ncbi:MAG: multiheme c-type cytochrome [Methanosarcina sp.]
MKSPRLPIIISIIFFAELIVSTVAAESGSLGNFTSDQFSKSGICSNCHGSSFGEWDGSMHSNADSDFFYQAMLQEYSVATESQGLSPDFCSRCHTPIGVVSAEIPPLDGSHLSEVSKEGVQCDFCHSVAESEGIGNAPFILEPGDVKWGNRSDAESASHETEAHEFYNESAYCGMCHNIYHPVNNLTLGATYTEWKESPYAEEGVNCQACHMTPGIVGFEENPGKAASTGPEREHVYTHYFVGANAFVTDIMGESRHEKRAIEYLQHAAELEVNAPDSAEPNEQVEVEVKITNVGAGHKIPTGVTEDREMWLELIVEDSKGRELHHSGALDSAGKIDSETTVYHTVFADSEGKPTIKLWEAEIILSDNRIGPREFAVEKHSFIMPENASNHISTKAVLHYRSAPQEHIDELFGEGAYKVPVIDMATCPEEEKTSTPGIGTIGTLIALSLGGAFRRLKR